MKTLTHLKKTALRLYRDDRGAEGLEKLLIIAAVVLPLLAILIFFGDDIVTWLTDRWEDVKGESEVPDTPF